MRMTSDVPFRLVVHQPPSGVVFRIQVGSRDLLPPTRQTGATLEFDFALNLRSPTATESVRLGGPLVQGRPGNRFLYLNSGSYAGQADTCWARRAKISLEGVGDSMVERAQRTPGCRITGHLAGTGRDGGPVCASTRLNGSGWTLVAPAAT